MERLWQPTPTIFSNYRGGPNAPISVAVSYQRYRNSPTTPYPTEATTFTSMEALDLEKCFMSGRVAICRSQCPIHFPVRVQTLAVVPPCSADLLIYIMSWHYPHPLVLPFYRALRNLCELDLQLYII